VIFVTVGSQMPFDRLVRAMDDWARRNDHERVLCQTGDTQFAPRSMKSVARMLPQEFEREVAAADLVVSHAGMGTILTCLLLGTPIVVLPRLGSQNEHRNDHQVDTCMHLKGRPGIFVADDVPELIRVLDSGQWSAEFARIIAHASPELLARIRYEIERSQKLPIRRRLLPATRTRAVTGAPDECAAAARKAAEERRVV
jgi:UDP-N-acetylglucosamine transferase subunit ALG13